MSLVPRGYYRYNDYIVWRVVKEKEIHIVFNPKRHTVPRGEGSVLHPQDN